MTEVDRPDREGLAELIVGARGSVVHPEHAACGRCGDARAAAEAILAAGWRPPLPKAGPLSREELGHRVSEVALKWSREQDDRPGSTATWEELAPEFRELHMRVGEALFGLGMTFSPIPSPLPDSETEPDAMQWGYREYEDEDVDPVREEYARFRAQDEHLKLVQREVRFGPWIEVTS